MNTKYRNDGLLGAFSCVTPLLIYMLVSVLASTLATFAWIFYKRIDIYQTGDINQIQQTLYGIMQQDFAEINYISMIIGYVILIPVFLIMYRKDQKADLVFWSAAEPEKEKKPYGLWERKSIPGRFYGILVLGGIATCIAGSNLVTLSGLQTDSESYKLIEQMLTSGRVWLQVLISGLCAPVMEELLFRGLIFRRFNRTRPMIMAMFWSALVFALFHGNMVQGIYAFSIGFMACFVYYRYRSLIAPIVLHMSVNITSIILTDTTLMDFIFESLPWFFIVTLAGMALIVWCLYLIELKVRPYTE